MSKHNKNKKDLLTDTYILKKKNFPIRYIVKYRLIKEVNFLIKNLRLNDGLGLSAVQLKLNRQLCIIKHAHLPYTLYNPKLLPKNNCKGVNLEACLSLPHLNFKNIQRFCKITISFISIVGDHFKLNIYKVAVLLEHEIDHLNGNSLLNYT